MPSLRKILALWALSVVLAISTAATVTWLALPGAPAPEEDLGSLQQETADRLAGLFEQEWASLLTEWRERIPGLQNLPPEGRPAWLGRFLSGGGRLGWIARFRPGKEEEAEIFLSKDFQKDWPDPQGVAPFLAKGFVFEEILRKGFGSVGVFRSGPTRTPWLVVAIAGGDHLLALAWSVRSWEEGLSRLSAGGQQGVFVVNERGQKLLQHEASASLPGESLSNPIVSRFLRGDYPQALAWSGEQGARCVGAFSVFLPLEWAVVSQRCRGGAEPEGARSVGLLVGMWIGVLGFLLTGIFLLYRRVGQVVAAVERNLLESERKLAETTRLQGKVLESSKLNAIGELGAGVAHEINNPLGGVLGLTQLLLRKKKETDPDVQFLRRIEEEAKRCKEITGNLLRFSEQQRVEYREPLRLERVLGMTVDLFSKKLESQRIRIERAFVSELPRVLGNEGQLQRAFLNAILNAETAMPEGGTLTLSTRDEGAGWVSARIRDTGKGIPRDNLDRVFEPFFTTKDNWGGAGLGLSVIYQIVKDHGGEVALESEVGKGTEVIFRFPVQDRAPTLAPK